MVSLDRRIVGPLLLALFVILQIWGFVHFGLASHPNDHGMPSDCTRNDSRAVCFR